MERTISSACSALSTRDLEAQITELAGHLNAANHRWLTLIAEFDRRAGWSDWATPSCAHWLNWKCGIDLGAAREKVRVAHALEQLPLIGAAMARGELSYSKVRALTRVACAQTEDLLLSIALHGTAHHVETVVRHFRRAREAEELSREARQQASRGVHYYFDDDGSLVLKARLPAETGALLLKALGVALPEVSLPDVSAETSIEAARGISAGRGMQVGGQPSLSARRADALGVVAESFVKQGVGSLNGGERHQIVLRVDAETLRHSSAGRCELEDGPALPAESARRIACDASMVTLIENERGEPLNLGRKTRTIPPALRRALNSRDRGCRFPGCTHQRFIDGHHIKHWADGGHTNLANLVSLCRFHHRLVHEGAVVVRVPDDGALRFVKPEGASLESVAPGRTQALGDWTALVATHRDRAIHIDARTAASRWRGESIDYGLAVEVLIQRARRMNRVGPASDVSAETRVQSENALRRR